MPTNGPNATDEDVGQLASQRARVTVEGNQDGGTLAEASVVDAGGLPVSSDDFTLSENVTLDIPGFFTGFDLATLSEFGLADTPLSDDYNLSDAFPIELGIDDGPEATMADAVTSATAAITVAEAYTCTDTEVLTTVQSFDVTETGTLSEEAVVESNVPGGPLLVDIDVDDTATLAEDQLITGVGAPIAEGDSASLFEEATIAVTLVVGDSGTLAEGLLVAMTATVFDTATLADTGVKFVGLFSGSARRTRVGLVVRARGQTTIGRS